MRNYKSVGQADIELHPITVFVGRTGAGKSNLLDAIRFVTDALDYSLDHAIRDRGGIDQVRRRSTGHPRNFALAFELALSPMYESWFVAASRSLGAYLTLRPEDDPSKAESRMLGKSWLKDRMTVYSETADQPRMTAAMDLRQCRANSRSFDKLCRELERCQVSDRSDFDS